MLEETIENHPEVIEARRLKMELQAQKDLESIKQAFPDLTAEKNRSRRRRKL